MDAKELRIGNWVNTFFDKEPKKIISGIQIDQITKYGEAEPIPLTEQWLLDFGFIEYKDGSFNKQMYANGIGSTQILITNNQNKDDIFIFWLDGKLPIQNNYIYVHQLQNLYHALTNKELTNGK